MKINPEEISLCKQIAEKHRKDLKIGMYVWRTFCKTVQLIYRLEEEEKEIFTVILKRKKLNKLYWNNLEAGWLIPLWTISDCLEFLRKKGWNDIVIEIRPYYDDVKCFAERGEVEKGHEHEVEGEGKTPLEACLKAVLAVLEEK